MRAEERRGGREGRCGVCRVRSRRSSPGLTLTPSLGGQPRAGINNAQRRSRLLSLAHAALHTACASTARSGQQRASQRACSLSPGARAPPPPRTPPHSPAPAHVSPRAPPCAPPCAPPQAALRRALPHGHVIAHCGRQTLSRGGQVLRGGCPKARVTSPPERLSPCSTILPPQGTAQQCLYPTSIPPSSRPLPQMRLLAFERSLCSWPAGEHGVVRRGVGAPARRERVCAEQEYPPPPISAWSHMDAYTVHSLPLTQPHPPPPQDPSRRAGMLRLLLHSRLR